jgi:hypothetical protein
MRSNWWMSLVAAGALLSLSGCGGGVRQALGMTKQSPDEFQVVAQVPLTMPPDFNLRPPEPGAPRPQEGTAAQQGQTAILSSSGGGTAPALGSPSDTGSGESQSNGEVALLQNAGATGINPNIRQEIDAETAAQVERDKGLIERLVFWHTPQPYGTVVDPVAESKRLQENQALGKPVTEGETPIITVRRKGVLEGIF